MTPSEQIDNLIATHPDWGGEALAKVRASILSADPKISEEWKWMGSPVWELNGIICVGNIHAYKVKLTFPNGAALQDPDKLFNNGLSGGKWRSIDILEGDRVDEKALKSLVLSAISFNQSK